MSGNPIDYESEYKRLTAENESLTKSLNEYIDSNIKLTADLKVLQQINRKTMGTTSNQPNQDEITKTSLSDAIAKLKKEIK